MVKKMMVSALLGFSLLAVLFCGLSAPAYAQAPTATSCEQIRDRDLAIIARLRDEALKQCDNAYTAQFIQKRYDIQKAAIQNAYDTCVARRKLYNQKPNLSNWPPRYKVGGNTTKRTGKQSQ